MVLALLTTDRGTACGFVFSWYVVVGESESRHVFFFKSPDGLPSVLSVGDAGLIFAGLALLS